MKKLIGIIILLSSMTISLFTSCGNGKNNSTDFINDRYIYRVDNFKLYCYDLVNKTCVLACPDPLCEHGNDCPITNLEETTITDKCIFLHKGTYGRAVTMSVYDLATNKIKEIANGVQSNTVTMANEYAFFTMSHYEYNEDGNIEKEVFDLYRYNTTTGEVKVLNNESLKGEIYVNNYDNERIVWYGMNYKYYFSSDYDFNNIIEETNSNIANAINTIDGYIYESGLEKDEYGNSMYTKKTNLETGEAYTVFDKAESLRWANQETKSGFLYRPTEIVLVEIDGEKKYIRQGINKIVYVSAEDPSKTFEFQLSENIVTASIYAEHGSKWYLGDYTSTNVAVYSYDEEGNRYLSTGMFVINCETGESFVIENEYTKRSYPVQTVE